MNIAFDPKSQDALPAVAEGSAALLTQRAGRTRLDSIDLLRGVVMIVMALDHTRDFFSANGFNPHDVGEPGLFLTRWVTHFCAPTFILLAGVSAYLYGAKGRPSRDLSRFLFARGIFLVLIEFSVVRLAWTFSLRFDHLVAQVIFAIGVSMIVLAALVHAPRWMIAAIALALIAGHNVLDGVNAEQFGAAAPLWHVLHQPGFLEGLPGPRYFVLYPLIPWIGVMAAGYALGPVFTRDRSARIRELLALGIAASLGFVTLRGANFYGDPTPWHAQESLLASALSFINCEKYPPSLLYLCMTLGPVLIFAALAESVRGPIVGWIATFGRVPLFYYIVHIFLIHTLAVLFAWVTVGNVGWLFGPASTAKPVGYGLDLAGIYAVWVAVVVSLYPLCRWFAAVKRRRDGWWWSFL